MEITVYQKNHSADDVITEARSFSRFDRRRRFRSDSTGIHGAYPESDLRFLELIVLKECRHFPFIEAPGLFSILLKNFLTGYKIGQTGLKKTVSIFIEFYYFAQHSVEMIE